jgi:hypothetical protein
MNNDITKAVVTVAEMARMAGLSRARFYQLVGEGVFPMPCYSVESRRPQYVEEQQAQVLEARRRNLGINGRPVLFYARRSAVSPKPTRRPQAAPDQRQSGSTYQPIIDAVKGLGMASATTRDVRAAVAELYPAGVNEVVDGEVIRAVFLHLRRQNSSDNVGR